MKKLFNTILVVAVGCLAWTSCSSDDYTEKVNSVQVVAADKLLLEAVGGSATATVSGEGLSVKSASEWLTASISGSVVTVSADANTSRESRHTTVTITASNGDQQIVNVSQYGAIFTLDAPTQLSFNDDARKVSYYSKYNLPLEVKSNADWLKVSVTSDSLNIALDANTTGHPRSGYVYYNIGTISDSIFVAQCEFDTDVLGKIFYFAGLDLSKEEDELIAEFGQFSKADDGSYTFDFFQYGWSVPVTLGNPGVARLSLSNNIGKYAAYTIGFVGWDLEQGYIAWDSSISLDAIFDYDEEAGVTIAEIADNGSWEGYYIEGIRFEAWNAAGTRLGCLEAMGWPFLEEYVASSSPAKKGAPKQKKAFRLDTTPVKVK